MGFIRLAGCHPTSESGTPPAPLTDEENTDDPLLDLPLCNAHAGDLIISELMIDPTGDDRGQEWIEITNPLDHALVLTRMVIVHTDATGDTVRWRHDVRTSLVLNAGGRWVLGSGVPVPNGSSVYNAPDLILTNGGGVIQLMCRDEVVDRVAYGDAVADARMRVLAGVALQRDGVWCHANNHDAYADHAYGTPGAPNRPCVQTTCWDDQLGDDGDERAMRAPEAGQIWINEVFADPEGSDAHKEWIEIAIDAGVTRRPIDLNRLTITQSRPDGSGVREWTVDKLACVPAYPGEFVIIGMSADHSTSNFVGNGNGNGNDDVHAAAVVAGDTISNEASRWVLRWDQRILNTTLVPAAVSKTSTSLAPRGNEDNPEADLNSNPAPTGASSTDQWCVPMIGHGTPGAENVPCGPVCYEGDVLRSVRQPRAGELRVHEVVVDPDTPAADDRRDWLEIRSWVDQPRDLNGMRIVNTALRSNPSTRILAIDPTITRCVQVPARGAVVLAGARAIEQGIPAMALLDAPSTTMLFNEPSSISLMIDDAVIDTMTYPVPVPGASYAQCDGIAGALPQLNSTLTWSWITSGSLQAGAYGSPGQINAVCRAAEVAPRP